MGTPCSSVHSYRHNLLSLQLCLRCHLNNQHRFAKIHGSKESLPDDPGRQAIWMCGCCLKLTGFESCSKAKLFLTERISPKLLLRKLLPGWIMGSPLTSNFNNFGSLKSLPPPSHTFITSTSSTQEAEVSTSWALTRVPPHRSRSPAFLVKTRALQGSSPGPLLSPPTTL